MLIFADTSGTVCIIELVSIMNNLKIVRLAVYCFNVKLPEKF